jgi:hypothetical protein
MHAHTCVVCPQTAKGKAVIAEEQRKQQAALVRTYAHRPPPSPPPYTHLLLPSHPPTHTHTYTPFHQAAEQEAIRRLKARKPLAPGPPDAVRLAVSVVAAAGAGGA